MLTKHYFYSMDADKSKTFLTDKTIKKALH